MNAEHLLGTNDFKLIRTPGGSDRLILAFLNKDKDGRLRGIPLFRGLGANVLLVNCHRIPPKKGNLDALLNMIPQLTAEIRTIVESNGPSRLFAVGSSLSAFPAIIVGTELQAERIIAMSPETLIGMSGSRSSKRLQGKASTYENADLVPFLELHTPRDIRIIVGELDVIDLYAAHRLSKNPNVHLYTLPNVAHGTLGYLSRNETLKELLLTIGQPGFSLDLARGNLAEGPLVRTWYRATRKLRADPAFAESGLKEVLHHVPDNIAALRHMSQALMLQERHTEALPFLTRAAHLAPSDDQIKAQLAELHAALMA